MRFLVESLPRDVKTVGVLVGGVDGALLAALLMHLGVKPVVFTAGTVDSHDIQSGASLSRALGVRFIPSLLDDLDLKAQLRVVIERLRYCGLFSVCSGLLLHSCLRKCAGAGIDHVVAGNGADLLYGGGLVRETVEREHGQTFHDRFWTAALQGIIMRRHCEPDQVNVYGTMGAAFGIRFIMPFESFHAAQTARQMDAAVFYNEKWDKVPVRSLALRLGVPDEIASRDKNPFQRSSNAFVLLDEQMRDDVSSYCPDHLSATYNAKEDPFIALRYYLALLFEKEAEMAGTHFPHRHPRSGGHRSDEVVLP
jgi:asparagine synthetase B (glutamine-hydrolysing)